MGPSSLFPHLMPLAITANNAWPHMTHLEIPMDNSNLEDLGNVMDAILANSGSGSGMPRLVSLSLSGLPKGGGAVVFSALRRRRRRRGVGCPHLEHVSIEGLLDHEGIEELVRLLQEGEGGGGGGPSSCSSTLRRIDVKGGWIRSD